MRNFLLTAFLLLSVSVISQNMDKVDKRALKKYSPEELTVMPAVKIEQINYLYNASFIIPDELKGVVNPAEIDVALYTLHRKENDRVKIDLGLNDEKKTGKYIILLSHKEVDKAFEEIEKKNNQIK